jgi:hypothetical protein
MMVRGKLVQPVQPGEMTVQAVEREFVQADPFERLLLYAGVDDLEQWPPRERPLDREGATRLLAYLLNKPLQLRRFPQRMGACYLLREVLESGAATRDELNRRVGRFRHIAVLRPDGYLAGVLTGRTVQRAGPGPVELKDGVFQANGFVLGQFYTTIYGTYLPVDAQMRPLPGSAILGEVYNDSDLFGRVMDGVEEAFFALAMAIGKFLSQPVDSLIALKNLPAGVAALIASSPEYLERFELMTTGEQIEAASKLVTTLITTFAGGGAVSASVTRGLGGMEVAGLSLSAQGTLALSRVAIPAGQAVTALVTGAGAMMVVQNSAPQTATSSASASKDAPGGFIDPKTVRFTQDSIASELRGGGSLDDLAKGLQSGKVKPADIPPIRVFERDGKLFTLDNRRLEAFRRAGVKVPYRRATPEEVADESWKFTTKNAGESVRVRGE